MVSGPGIGINIFRIGTCDLCSAIGIHNNVAGSIVFGYRCIDYDTVFTYSILSRSSEDTGIGTPHLGRGEELSAMLDVEQHAKVESENFKFVTNPNVIVRQY